MKHIFILLFILCSTNAAFAQTNNPAPVITRYYYFTGTIDTYPVTFNLFRVNEQFSGSYYYNSTEEPIAIYGELDKNNFLKLSAYDVEGNQTEAFSGPIKDSSFAGTWSFKGKLLPFRLTQNKQKVAAFDYVYTSGSKKLPKQKYGRSQISYDAATIWPTPSSTLPAAKLVKQVIFEEFGEKSGQGEIGTLLMKEKNATLYTGKNVDKTETYAIKRKIQVVYSSEKLLTLSSFAFVDGGGAHGNSGISYTCIDLVHNRTLGITDVLDTVACNSQLKTILEKKFRAAYHVKKEEKIAGYLLVDTIPLSNNISLTSKGIGFNYVPYEIGAYAMGEVRLFIPYKELSSCLTSEFKKLNGD